MDGDGKDDLAVQLSNFYGSGAKLQVLHGGAKGLDSKPWRSTSRKVPGDAWAGEIFDARDYDHDKRDEIAVVDSLYIDPKSHWWFTEGTAKNDAAFTTAGFVK
jgi:hypothetical protein